MITEAKKQTHKEILKEAFMKGYKLSRFHPVCLRNRIARPLNRINEIFEEWAEIGVHGSKEWRDCNKGRYMVYWLEESQIEKLERYHEKAI